jgi:hypothetical protein
MSIADVEATLSDAARQERGTVGGEAIAGKFLGNTISVTHQRVNLPNGNVVDVEIPLVDKVDHKAAGRPVNKQYTMARNSVVARLNLTKWSEATVISCLPIPLESDSCLDPLRTAIVPAVQDGQEFNFLTFKHPHLEPAQVGPDAPLSCFDFQPIMLAKEFEGVYASHGGVFAFIGKPEDVLNPNWEHKSAWAALKAKAIAWMEAMHREARGHWDQKVFYAVREPHRAAIRRLYHLGRLKELPAELDKQRDTNIEYPTCSKCQKRAESPHAIECLHCNWILDPRSAFENNVIDENSPHLERLTRATVKEMGISIYVAETIDEKPIRLKAGLIKPKSEAVMNFEEQARELEAQDRAVNTGKTE